jgi:hypothetical protein
MHQDTAFVRVSSPRELCASWVALGDESGLKLPRWRAAAIAATDGRVFFIGGDDLGGASRSLRTDTQGKLLGTALMEMELPEG